MTILASVYKMQLIIQFLVLLIVRSIKTQNDCTKWLESIENSYPYLSTHNSYHKRQTFELAVNDNYKANITMPKSVYNNPSLTDQLSNGVVGIELDIHPPNDLYGNNDFPVYHSLTIDQTSICLTFRKCLNEINEWFILNKYLLSSPLMIYIDIKEIENYSQNELELINNIWTKIFNESDLYSPSIHNVVKDLYNDWSNVCLEDINGKIIGLTNEDYAEIISDEIFLNINMFILCDCQNSYDFCIILRDLCLDENINPFNRSKYIYRSWIYGDENYPKWNEYPLIYDMSDNNTVFGEHLLGFMVNDELIKEIYSRFPEYINYIKNPLTVNEWQYLQTAAFIDSLNNNNGIWEKDDLYNFLKILDPNYPNLNIILSILFWIEGFSDWDILDPKLWAKLDCLYQSGYGLDDQIITANLSELLIEICYKINRGYHYLYNNIDDINYYDLCDHDNITIPKIDKSKITADCTSQSELKTFIICIIIGLFLLTLMIIILFICIIDCCFCKSKIRKKCCKCCNKSAHSDKTNLKHLMKVHEIQLVEYDDINDI